MGLLLTTILVALGPAAPGGAEDAAVTREMQRDVLLRGMVDELTRSRAELNIEGMEDPYFIEYAVADGCRVSVAAVLGSVTSRGDARYRGLRSDVRVGSYELDNTNFSGGGGWGGGPGADMPIEDDYDAIRQALWWITDQDYKSVAEDLVRKKAFMESKLITDKPADFSREEPVVHLEDRAALTVDAKALEEAATGISKLFREYPDVQRSQVGAGGTIVNRYMVNTEGTRLRTAVRRYSLAVQAAVQTEEGMLLSDSLSYHSADLSGLPPQEQILSDCREMVQRLLAVRGAPKLESYSGPVLFDAEAAVVAFMGAFAPRFGGGQRNVGVGTSPDDFSKKLQKRILPRSLHVIDDPALTTLAGEPALGGYRFDDQGVAAQSVTLVENGRLHNLLMARNPSKEFARSNGHGRGLYTARPVFSNLLVRADDALAAAALKQELIEAFQDEGLEFGMRVGALGGYRGGGGAGPLVMYKVFPDGREEMVRAAELSDLNLKAFKRVLAVGDTPCVRHYVSGAEGLSYSVAVPALLFEELDLGRIDRDFDKPPILPSPLARADEPAAGQ